MLPSRIEAARAGTNPTVICRMPSGWAVLCDWQYLPGYTILLADPPVPDLNALSLEQSNQFLQNMRLIGDALLEVTDSHLINYQILCNLGRFLHAHICPRYHWEAPDKQRGPTAHYDKKQGPFFDTDQHRDLMERIRKAIESRLGASHE